MERKTANEYPQELLNLFDRYVHGEIDRRQFLAGAQKFAVGGVTALAIWESLRPHYAWAQQVPKDDRRIKTEAVTVPSPKGNTDIKGNLVHPVQKTKQKVPGVLVTMRTGDSTPISKTLRDGWEQKAIWHSRRTASPPWAGIPATRTKDGPSSKP